MKNDLHLGDFTSRASETKDVPKYYGETLVQLGSTMSQIVVLTADLAPATECDLFQNVFPDRFFTTGIAEANMVGISGGLARLGFIPFVHTFSVFMCRRALDQIAMQVAYPKLNIKLCGFLPGLTTLLGVSIANSYDDDGGDRRVPGLMLGILGLDLGIRAIATLSEKGPEKIPPLVEIRRNTVIIFETVDDIFLPILSNPKTTLQGPNFQDY